MKAMFRTLDLEELRRYCSNEAIKHLENSLDSLERLAPPTPSFPLYGKSDISVVTDFFANLETSKYPAWMMEYEKSRQEKFGPQGGHAPWKELLPDFVLYGTRCKPMKYVDMDIIKEMKVDYGRLHARKLSAVDAMKTLIAQGKIQERAAGWNQFDLKKTDVEAQKEAIRLCNNGEWRQGYMYTFSRYNKLKKRIFMPGPFSLMIKQAQYFNDFLVRIQSTLRSQEVSPMNFWAEKNGFDFCSERWTQLYHSARSQFPRGTLIFIQRDFEKMDTTVGPSQLQNLFIPMLESALSLQEGDLTECILASSTMPIITPSGVFNFSAHGVGSGVTVTNGSETCDNDYYDRRTRKLTDQECKHRGIKVLWVYSAGNGDDGATAAITDNPKVFIEIYTSCANKAAEECQHRVQAKKWHVSSDFGLYCQNMVWEDKGDIKMAYPATLILNSIVNPEHEYKKSEWDKDYRDLDIVQKLDNGKGLPYFEELVNYVANGTKYPLMGKAEKETKRILSKYEKYRALQPEGERWNREWNPSTSPSIKLLLSRRS